MKLLILLTMFLVIGCEEKDCDEYPCSEQGYRIEQLITKTNFESLSESGTLLSTLVWYKGEIIASWYDDAQAMSDSTKRVRRENAQRLVKKLKE